MRQKQFEVEPKPFALVPIPKEKPNRKDATTHERFKNLTGQMELVFTVVSEYLFVGSGGYEFDPNAKGDRPDIWHTFYRRNGQICVPGTSIKGAIRSILEAISNSCLPQSRRGERVHETHQPCRSQNELCPACRLFGTTGLRGRVCFTDSIPMGDVKTLKVKISELWEPKRWTNARRFYENKTFQPLPNQRPERNFRFVEAVPKETRFQTTLEFENLSEAELGLLFFALGFEPRDDGCVYAFAPKLGGAKPRCFGNVQFQPKRLRLWKVDSIVALINPKEEKGEALINFIRLCLQACQQSDLLHKESWQAFVKAMQPKTESCPRGNY